MKKIVLLPLLALSLVTVGATGCSNSNAIVVGASPSPHAKILTECSAISDYITSKGYTLEVVTYQDYITPNKALNDHTLDANYFQHLDYLNTEKASYGYDLEAVAYIHYEPLNVYSQTPIADDEWSGKTISVIKDQSNADRALALLKSRGLIEDYDISKYETDHPEDFITIGSSGVTIQFIEQGLLTSYVNDGGIAVIPGNFALTSWVPATIQAYTLFGESEEVASASANLIACRSEDKESEKIKVLAEAFAQDAVKEYIEATFASTVVYYYELI